MIPYRTNIIIILTFKFLHPNAWTRYSSRLKQLPSTKQNEFMLHIFMKLRYLEQQIILSKLLLLLLVHVAFMQVPHDSHELPSTQDVFEAIITENCIFYKPFWWFIVAFYFGKHEENNEKIYGITFKYLPTTLRLIIHNCPYTWQ